MTISFRLLDRRTDRDERALARIFGQSSAGRGQIQRYPPPMEVEEAARRWAETWEHAWPARDSESIAALYAAHAAYRSHPLRDPEPGGAPAYTRREFAVEETIECRFGEPISAGDRAAVEWWASWVEDEHEVTLAGTTVLRFDERGLVVQHVDYWVQGGGRLSPFAGWGGSYR